ncbi:hypothetical protein KOAAANKH_00822 [Brevundimonas sp. NIBR10]|uniref:hypothetical protein n=1 Tax=Brevundimonas sp. NIBR10 TaxID=3015997 RepID=UPI0022F18444|nr:hypothetical protein [Brevundimonas sp. NIBR10]WGM45957.1 hypothetical protein KOAAANKH_00822 [Brevundimonas sp. NIBR10]
MGVSDDGLARLEEGLRGALTVLPPEDTEALWRDAGFAVPVPFFQSILIRGWHARRA